MKENSNTHVPRNEIDVTRKQYQCETRKIRYFDIIMYNIDCTAANKKIESARKLRANGSEREMI